jgi:maintenance of morphology protein 1
MSNNYLFTFKPTFTQGLIIGQLSILILIGLVLRYLFLDSPQYPFETSSYHPRVDNDLLVRKRKLDAINEENPVAGEARDSESAEWFNGLLRQASNLLSDIKGCMS